MPRSCPTQVHRPHTPYQPAGQPDLHHRWPLSPSLQVLLNPVIEVADLPLKTFYRYAVPTLGSGPPEPAAANFTGLPPHKTLTLGMDVPEPWSVRRWWRRLWCWLSGGGSSQHSWTPSPAVPPPPPTHTHRGAPTLPARRLVEPIQAEHDLDNLVLAELGPGQAMTAEFELEALLLTGMCIDSTSLAARIQDQIHPRGVQLQLGTATQVGDPAAGRGDGPAAGSRGGGCGCRG